MKLTPERRQEFLEALAHGAWVKDAARKIGATESCLYKLRSQDEAFAAEWKAAADLGDRIKLGAIEQEMQRRAVEGVEEPRFWKDRIVGHITKYSDTLLIVRAKALAPERYSERYAINSTAETTITIRSAPDYDLFRDTILKALRPYPEAFQAVADAMINLEERAMITNAGDDSGADLH